MKRALSALALAVALAVCRAQSAEKPPNILLILADDLGWGDVGFNGRKEWKTPNIDRLARQGTMFRRWYVGAVVCAPSRAVLMTGKYTIHNGVTANNDDLPTEETTIAEALRDLSYTTALFGKWHHGRPRAGQKTYVHPLDHGFDEFLGFTEARHAWEHFPTNLWFGREMKPVQGYTATLFADRAIDFLKRNHDRPFFVYLAFTEPHLKIEAPTEDIRRLRGRFNEKDPANPLNATYAAMIERMDREIGRVVKALDDLDLTRRTLVLFSSDHGATFEAGNQGTANYHDSNAPFRGHKRTLWEGGIRVPAVVRWPGKVPAGKKSDAIIHMMDVFPTLLAAAGGVPKKEWRLDGSGLLQVWLGRQRAPERTLFWEWRTEGSHQLAAMRGDLKLVLTGNSPPELFNVVTDPAERRNSIHEHAGLGQELRFAVTNWLATETRLPATRQSSPR